MPENSPIPLSARLLNYLNARPNVRFEPEELTQEFSGSSKDAIRKQLERHRRKGLIESEERVKQRDDGAKRYKVYYCPLQEKPLEKKEVYSENSVQQVSNPCPEEEDLLDNLNTTDSLSSRSENLSSRSQTLAQTKNDLLDAHSDLLDNSSPGTSVQQVKLAL